MFEMSYSEVPLFSFEILDENSTMEEILEANRVDIENLEKDKIKNHKHLWKYGYKKAELTDIEEVARVIQSDYRCYSGGIFKDGEAKNDSWLYQDLIIFDIDEGLGLEEAKEIFSPYCCLIATTRSHQKEKNGKICDRFRVILLAKERIFCEAEEYKEIMENIFKEYPFVDKACKDPSRIYFGHFDSEIWISGGDRLFDFYAYAKKIKKIKELQNWRDEQEKKFKQTPVREPDFAYLQDGTKKDWYERHWLTDKMKEKLKFYERFYAGNRNNYLYNVAAYLKKDLNFNNEKVKEAIRWLNDGALSERELNQTIFRSLRLV